MISVFIPKIVLCELCKSNSYTIQLLNYLNLQVKFRQLLSLIGVQHSPGINLLFLFQSQKRVHQTFDQLKNVQASYQRLKDCLQPAHFEAPFIHSSKLSIKHMNDFELMHGNALKSNAMEILKYLQDKRFNESKIQL